MSLWRKLFPKYNCRKCRDTFILESQYAMSRCDCEGSRDSIARTFKNFHDHLHKAEYEQRMRDFEKKLEVKP